MAFVEKIWQGRRKSSYQAAHVPKSLLEIPAEQNRLQRLSTKQLRSHSRISTTGHSSGPFVRNKSVVGPLITKGGSLANNRFQSIYGELATGAGLPSDARLSVTSPQEPKPEAEASRPKADEDGLKKPVFKNRFHEAVYNFIESNAFSTFILLVIVLNTATLISTTWAMVNIRWGWYFAITENVFLGIYIMEMTLKQYVYGLDYFSEGWNNLDFVIVLFSIMEFIIPFIVASNISWFGGTKIFRLLRIFRTVRAIRAFRVLRTIRFLSNLQVIMVTILQSIKSIGAIVVLISLFMYMFAVIGRGLYSEADPIHFSNLFYAWFTMFQLLTLDDWFDIYVITTTNDPSKWHVILYLLLYIVVEYFVFLNLFVAVLVDNFQIALEDQQRQNAAKKKGADESDEEDNYGMESSDDSSESEEEIEKERQKIEDISENLSVEDRHDAEDYFRLLVCLDYNMYILNEQQRILNLMVDMCMDSNDDV